MMFKNLPNDLKPREKILKTGAHTLNDIELIAVLLRTGTKDKDVLEVAKEFMQQFKTFSYMLSLSLEEIQKIKGIGLIKAIELLAIFELFRRINNQQPKVIKNDKHAVQFASSIIQNWNQESFIVIMLNNQNEIIYSEVLYKSDAFSISISPRDIVGLVLQKNAYKFYCLHNHPSGDTTPSQEDRVLTFRLKNICNMMGVNLIAHLVFNQKKEYQAI